MKRWLVTGGTGFLGRAVVAVLRDLRPDADIYLSYAHEPDGVFDRDHAIALDFQRTDSRACEALLRLIVPDIVIHCAGKTPPAASDSLFQINTRGTALVLDALRAINRPARVLCVGSAAELGPVPLDRLPAGEDCQCRPLDAYGLSKLAATRLALAQSRGGEIEVVVGRVFNLVGPSMPRSLAFGRFAHELVTATDDPIELTVGNLDARRDFVDVRDAARALIALAERGQAGLVYHVGTGVSHSVGDGLGALVRYSTKNVRIVSSAWTSDVVLDSRANVERIQRDTGWSPRIGFEESLVDLWREALRAANLGNHRDTDMVRVA